MPSDWALGRARRLGWQRCECKGFRPGPYKQVDCDGCIAAALDLARAEGIAMAEETAAERERWECYRIAAVPGHAMAMSIAKAILARGPMRGPDSMIAVEPEP